MKKALMIFGGIAAVLLLMIIIAAAIFIPRVLKLDREATTYIQRALPKIVENWNSQELIDRSTTNLIASAKSRDDLDRLFVLFRWLGPVKRLDKPKGAVFTSSYTGVGTVTVGNYTVQGKFEKGDATIFIQLFRANDAWKINGFRIKSEAFLPPKP